MREIFVNGSLPPERLQGPFGVCYVAFAGTHVQRYRGEKMLEVAARHAPPETGGNLAEGELAEMFSGLGAEAK